MSIDRYYGWLAWFQDHATRLGHPSGHDQQLTVHRRLRVPAGPPSGAAVHTLIVDALRATGWMPSSPHVLDAGCGLGGTTVFLEATFGGRYEGLTLSAVQRDRAAEEARRRGLADRCRFHVRSYDDDLTDLLPDGADLIVAIESLAHSPDPSRTVAAWARCLSSGGRLVVVDDMPGRALSDDDPDFQAFRRGWLCPRVASAERLRTALGAAGLAPLQDTDLTPLVPLRAPWDLSSRLVLSRIILPAARRTGAGVLLDALHGGLCLERLYRRGLMEYRLIVAAPAGR